MKGQRKNSVPDRQLSNTERVIRDNEKRRKKKRRRDRMIYIFLALFVAGAGIVLSLTVFFHIEVITATTDSLYYSEAEIIEASGIKLGENMFLQSLKNVSAKIEKDLPYIESAKTKISLPNKIIIQTTDAVPALAVEAGDTYYLLSKNAKILGTTGMAIPPDPAALVRGLTLKEPELGSIAEFNEDSGYELLIQLLTSIETNGLEKITEIDLTDTVDLRVWIEDIIRLDLGSINDVDKKLSFAKSVIAAEKEKNIVNPIYIDLRILREAHVRDITTSAETQPEPSKEPESESESTSEKQTESV